MSAQRTSHDVVVVGGGVMGFAVAYFLAAEHGIRSLIIERDAIASGASGGAAGELAASELSAVGGRRNSPAYTRFLLEAIDLHSSMAPALLEESGIDYLLTNLPMLRPAFDDDEATRLRKEMEEHRSEGIQGEWLEPENIHAMGSWLSDNAVGAVYSVEHQLEAYPFALALAQAAERHGVEVRTGEVTGLEREGGRATGVRMGDGEIVGAQRVVVANGPWTQHASAWMGIDLPVIPLRGQIVHLDLPPGTRAPRQAIFHETGYVLPKVGGDLLAGTTMEDAGFDPHPTVEAQNAIMEAAVRLAPTLLEAPIREVTACLRPYSKDERPIIGAVPGWESLYIATGHGFKGVTLSLITGKSLAQLIARGSSGFPLDEFSPARLVAG